MDAKMENLTEEKTTTLEATTPARAASPSQTPPNAGQRGRPSKFTEEARNRVIQALRGGNYRSTAAQYAGVSYATLRNWLKNGEDELTYPEYAEFLADVQKAEADGEVANLALIRKVAAEGNWNAAAWALERGPSSERWAKKDTSKLEISGPDGGPIDVNTTLGIDTTSIESLAAILARRARELADPLREDIVDAVVVDDYEEFRVVPGELTEGSPSLRSNTGDVDRPNPALGDEPVRSGLDPVRLSEARDAAFEARLEGSE